MNNGERYVLRVDAGEYRSNSVIGLLAEVLKHRFWHWKRGDGWID